jgi:hypothetical protein
MADIEVDVVDFESEEDDIMNDDTPMYYGNAYTAPTPTPKLKSTIMGGTSQLDDGGPENTKGRGFKKETDVEHNGCFAAQGFESLGLDGCPLP